MTEQGVAVDPGLLQFGMIRKFALWLGPVIAGVIRKDGAMSEQSTIARAEPARTTMQSISNFKRALLSIALAALVLGCNNNGERARRSPDTGLRGVTATEVRLMKDTMGGNEAEASNGLMTLRVRGLYQRTFSRDWYMGMKLKPLRDLTISKVTCYSFTGKNIRLHDSENRFHPPAGQFTRHIEREIDIRFIHPATSMLVTFYDEQGNVLSKFEITHIVDHMIGVGILPAANREAYENAQ
jgi:hypothetical protein